MTDPFEPEDDPLGRFHKDGTEHCAGMPPEIFFPDRTDRRTAAQAVRIAKAACDSCPRRLECWAKARYRQEKDGVWGGQDMFEIWDGRGTLRNNKKRRRQA